MNDDMVMSCLRLMDPDVRTAFLEVLSWSNLERNRNLRLSPDDVARLVEFILVDRKICASFSGPAAG